MGVAPVNMGGSLARYLLTTYRPTVVGAAGALALALSSLFAPRPVASAGHTPYPNRRYAVIIVLDGSRPGYFNLTAMPHLRSLLRRGVTYTQAFVGQELANTPPSHATIGTGVFPKHHGVEGFLWENPRTHLVDNPTETGAVTNGALEAVIRRRHVPSLARQITLTQPHATIGSVAGHKCYASDAMGTPDADYVLCALIYHKRWVAQAICAHRPPPGAINNSRWDVPIPPRSAGFGAAVQQWRMGGENARTARYAVWLFHRVHFPRVLMMNLSETDVFAVFAPHTSTRQFDAFGYPWRAGHLGPQWDDQHIPLVLAGPGIKPGMRSGYPACLVDIAPTVEHLLGAKTGRVDGVVLDYALRTPTAKGLAAQRIRRARLMPIIKAIQQRFGYR